MESSVKTQKALEVNKLYERLARVCVALECSQSVGCSGRHKGSVGLVQTNNSSVLRINVPIEIM